MMSMGESHHGLGRFREAIDYFTGALTILREIGNCCHEGFALTLLRCRAAALLDDLHVPKTDKLRTRITASGQISRTSRSGRNRER
jgi:hypothetical protein